MILGLGIGYREPRRALMVADSECEIGRPASVQIPPFALQSVVSGSRTPTDELKGLSRNRLDSLADPLGRTALRAWLNDNASAIGRRSVREPAR